MTDSSIEYNVVIRGILPGHKPGSVAEAVAPMLGLMPSDALHLFNGVAHTVLQRVDLSAAADFQAQLKALGIDASVAVFEDEATAPAEQAAPQEQAAPAEAPAAPVEPPPAPVEPPSEPAEAAPPRLDFEAEPDVPAEKPARTSGNDTDVELDLSMVDQAQSAPQEPEAEDMFDAFEKEAAEREDEEREDEEQAAAAEAPEPAADPSQGPDMDLDEIFGEGDDSPPASTAPPASKAPPAEEPAALAMAEAPAEEPAARRPAVVTKEITEEITAVDTGVDAATSLDASPIPNAAPGSNMLCPSCNTLQPRADQCPACGAVLSTGADAAVKTKKPRLPPQLPRAAVIAAAVAALAGAGIWLALGFTMDFDTGPLALVTGVLAGLGCGLQGGRGAKAGAVAAALALVAIAGAAYLLPREGAKDLPAPPQPDPAEVWSDKQALQWFEEAVKDAESFMTIDGSSAAVRKFMIEHNYTKARTSNRVPTADLQYFYDVDAKDLTWLVENQPDFEAWRQRMLGHLGGRQRVRLNVSAPPIEPPPPAVTMMQATFMLAGVVAAFGLGFIGFRRKA